MDRNRNLLFGVLALQLGKVSPTQLTEAGAKWDKEPSRDLPEYLVESGVLLEQDRALVQELVDAAIRVHDGDPAAAAASFGGEEQLLRIFSDTVILSQSGLTPTVPADHHWSATAPDMPVLAVHESPGRYRHISEYARGGMGRVLLVHDEHLGRNVALKELLPGSDAPGDQPSPVRRSFPYLARFLQEAQVTSQLEHPSIVPVYELGYRGDGTLYYSMKLVRGKTLAEALDRARNLRERLGLLAHFMDLCQAIAYAHSRGVIHRDIKPQNVMVGEFGETVVLDWGIAKVKGKEDIHSVGLAESIRLVQRGQSPDSGRTAHGVAMGTPAYMAPEQAKGDIDAIDERSDVYSLGVVLYELLTGRTPYEGGSAREVVHRVINEAPAPVGASTPDAPPELVAICERAMQRDPEKRYQSARDLAEEVQRFQSGALVQAYAYPFSEHLRRFVRRHKAVLATVAAALLVLLGLGVFYNLRLIESRNAERAQRVAAVQAQREAEAQKATAETQRLAAEGAREAERQQRLSADAARKEAEAQRKTAQEATEREREQREQAERARQAEEEQRLAAEKAQHDAEQAREAERLQRLAAEGARKQADEEAEKANQAAEHERRAREEAEAHAYATLLLSAESSLQPGDREKALDLLARADAGQRCWVWQWLVGRAGRASSRFERQAWGLTTSKRRDYLAYTVTEAGPWASSPQLDWTLMVWDVRQPVPLAAIPPFPLPPTVPAKGQRTVVSFLSPEVIAVNSAGTQLAVAINGRIVFVEIRSLRTTLSSDSSDGSQFQSSDYSPDDGRLMTVTRPGIIEIWDTSTANKLQTLTRKELEERRLPEVEDRADRSELFLLFGTLAEPTFAAYSSDGRFIATGHANGCAVLWDSLLEKEMGLLLPISVPKAVTCIRFSGDSSRVILGYEDGQVLVYAIPSCSALLIGGTVDSVSSVDLNEHGDLAVAHDTQSGLYLWDVDARVLLGREKNLWSSRQFFDSTGQRLVTEGAAWDVGQGFARVLHPQKQAWRPVLLDDEAEQPFDTEPAKLFRQARLNTIRFSGDGSRLLAFYHTCRLPWCEFHPEQLKRPAVQAHPKSGPTKELAAFELWDTRDQSLLSALCFIHDETVRPLDVALGPNGEEVYSLATDGEIRVWDVNVPLCRNSTIIEASCWLEPTFAKFRAKQGEVLLGRASERPIIIDMQTGRKLREIEIDAPLACDYTGRFLLGRLSPPSGKPRKSSSSGELVQEPNALGDPTAAPALSAAAVGVWSVDTGKLLSRLESVRETKEPATLILTTTPDGSLLLLNDALYEISTGRLRYRLRDLDNPVNASFSPDGRRMVLGSWYERRDRFTCGEMLILDVTTGQRLFHVTADYGVLACRGSMEAFSPDGQSLVALYAPVFGDAIVIWKAPMPGECEALLAAPTEPCPDQTERMTSKCDARARDSVCLNLRAVASGKRSTAFEKCVFGLRIIDPMVLKPVPLEKGEVVVWIECEGIEPNTVRSDSEAFDVSGLFVGTGTWSEDPFPHRISLNSERDTAPALMRLVEHLSTPRTDAQAASIGSVEVAQEDLRAAKTLTMGTYLHGRRRELTLVFDAAESL